MSTGVLRYGVVGAGRVFERYHLPCLRERPGFRLVAACDTDVDRVRAALDDDVLVTADLDTFFAAGRPDVVAVCTPNDAHTVPVLTALSNGAKVLCEKPLAADIGEARVIAAASDEVRVNLPYRFHDLLPAFIEAVPDGPCDITVRFATSGQRLWRPATAWYDDSTRAGGGALVDLGPHALDLLFAAFGTSQLVSAVLDRTGVEDRATVDLTVARGPARLMIDRASRRLELTMTARHTDGVTTLDIRRGQVRRGADVMATTTANRVELAAISRFLDAAAGGSAQTVSAAEALELEEIIAAAYAIAGIDAELTA